MVTIKDIARMAGVSVSTVSKALNDSVLVKPTTKRRIVTIAREHGYTRNLLASQLVARKSKIIGLVLDKVDNPIFSQIVSELHADLNRANFSLILTLSPTGLTFFRQLHLECVILWGGFVEEYPQVLKELDKLNMTGLVLGATTNMATPSIAIDREEAISMAVDHLAELGHQRIVFLGQQMSKQRGFVTGLRRSGLNFTEDDIVPCESTWYGGYHAIRNFDFESQRRIKSTAFIGLNNLVTAGAMHALLELGYRIPSDISIIGYDNLPDSEFGEVPLTTVGPVINELVEHTVEMVRKLSAGENVTNICVDSVLMERKSVGPAPI